MHPTLPLLVHTDFPTLRRTALDTLQVNLGYRCNQSCVHCHVNAGPNRTEMMDEDTVNEVLAVLEAHAFKTLDLTGGAPELNVHFRTLVTRARSLGLRVIDRWNLTILRRTSRNSSRIRGLKSPPRYRVTRRQMWIVSGAMASLNEASPACAR